MFSTEDMALAEGTADSTNALAELAVAQLYVLPQTIQSTDAVTFGADVRNDGSAESGAFMVRFALDDGEVREIQYPSLRPGESHWEEWQHEPLSATMHTVSVHLDPYNQVQEANKQDNTASLPFLVNGAVFADMSSSLANTDVAAAFNLGTDGATNGDPTLDLEPVEGFNYADAAAVKGKKKKKTTNVDFSDESDVIEGDAFKLPSGDNGPQYIKSLLQDLKHSINLYWNSYRDGLQNFETRMEFSSDQEAEAKYLQAVLKGVAKEALGMALEKAGKELGGPWGKIISVTKAAIEAWADEKERSENAQGEVKIADYIEGIRNGIEPQQKKMFDAVDAQRDALLEEFNNTGTDHPQHNKVGANGEIYGPQATLVKQLKQHVDAFGNAIPNAPYFQEEFTTRFANTPGWTDMVSHGARLAGMLYFGESLYKGGDKWTLKSVSESWKLVTKAPKPERLATSLERSLKAENKKPYQSQLPKMVQLSIEIEETGPNTFIDGYIHFTKDPDKFDVRTNYGDKLFKEAWEFVEVQKAAFDTTKIEGSSE